MENPELNRRDFNRLTMAAFGGVLAGTLAGCGEEKKPEPKGTPPGIGGKDNDKVKVPPEAARGTKDGEYDLEIAAVGVEKHACRGLNACKNQDKDGMNDCAGQGECATLDSHTCGHQNDCKGQGGCGANAVQNACKGEGNCAIPLMDSAWKKARTIFEAKMKKAGTEFGAAPAAKKE